MMHATERRRNDEGRKYSAPFCLSFDLSSCFADVTLKYEPE
nr:MAG TPA: hypothetical protein [Caudoviricetes sp.]